jgi:hypothetical protein
MTRVSAKAVFIGAVVDIVLSMCLGGLVVLVWSFVATSSGEPLTTSAPELGTNTSLLLIFLVIGLSALLLGGFVAGKIAKRDHVLHGFLVGTISLAAGLLIGGSANPAWFTTTVVALNIPTAIFGALLAKSKTANPVAGRPQGA